MSTSMNAIGFNAETAAPVRRETCESVRTVGTDARRAYVKGRADDSRVPSWREEDHVDLSSAARSFVSISDAAGSRTDLVNSVRAQIAAGTYETADKIDAAAGAILAIL